MSTQVTTSVEIAAGYRRSFIFDKVRRLERYPEFMPDVKRVRILEQDGAAGASEWDVDIEGCPLHWIERDRFDWNRFSFEFHSVEGDFDEFSGCWQVLDSPGGTRVVFSVSYLVGIPVIEDIIGPILKIKMEKNTMRMLHHLKQEVENSGPSETREHERLPARFPLRLAAGEQRVEAVACDISQGGIRLEGAGAFRPGTLVDLLLERCGAKGTLKGEVVWRSDADGTAGVRFLARQAAGMIAGVPVLDLAAAG